VSYNEQETRFFLIDPLLRTKGYDDYQRIRMETPAPVEPTGPKGRRRKGSGRTDYLLCVQAGLMPKPLPVAVLEAKKASEDPLKGMQQAKGYSDCKRFDVKYIFATNGHLYGEYDLTTKLQGGTWPFADFPPHIDLTARYAKDTGIDVTTPEAAILFQRDSPAWSKTRYYQDAAIRAAFEKIIQCHQRGEAPRVLLSMATGAGKTIIATNLLWRLSQAGQLPKPGLFLCDRDELREQAYEKLHAAFGDNARIVKNENGKNAAQNARVHIATYQTLGIDDQSEGKDFASFLAIAYEHIARKLGQNATSTDLDTLKHETFFGREKENLVFPIALANLVLHGIDQPNLWHGNTLTGRATYDALFANAPQTFDVILTNPPFGGKEGKDAQKNFAFETSSTQVLFVQDILKELSPTGTCAIVLDEGLLFRTNESAFVDTKRKLTEECNLWCILSLPGGVFSTAGAGVKTNLLFFTKGKKTEKIWYYDLSHVKVGKKTPLTLAHFGFGKNGEVLEDDALPATLTREWASEETNEGKLFPSYTRMLAHCGTKKGESRYSWTVDFADKRKQARADMQPLLEEAAKIRGVIVDLKVQLRELKRSYAAKPKIDAIETAIAEKQKSTRELEAKAAEIDAATFDLKAVNPNAVIKRDNRTPEQIIQSIEDQSKIVSEALGRLRALLNQQSPDSPSSLSESSTPESIPTPLFQEAMSTGSIKD
jgi:hypothetical protein